MLLTALVARLFPLGGLATAASRSASMVSSSSERPPSIIWILSFAGSTFVVIITCLDRTELLDDRVLALVRGGTLVPALRRVLAGFALLGMEAAQLLMLAENNFFPLEVESLRK